MKNFLCTSLIALFLCSSQACSNGNIELEEARIEQANKLEEAARVEAARAAKELEELAEKEKLEAERSQPHTVPSEYVKEKGRAFGAHMDSFIKTHQDKNSYAKVNVYQVGTKEIK